MKLLYLWLENYNDRIKSQGFCFSPEYLIRFDNDLNKLFIRKNEKYISGFYGKNILDVTAIVGENGAGKTTVAKCIYDICSSVMPVDDDIDEYKFTKFIIYLKEEGNRQYNELYVFYYSKEPFEKDIANDISVEWIDLHGMSADTFERALRKHEMSTVYFTNAFDVSHTVKNQGLGELAEGSDKKSICNSPILMIKREMQYIQESYGAQSKESGLILTVIQRYAQKMGIGIEDAYARAFSYNFLVAVRHTPGSIAAILPVFSDFGLCVVEFGEYIVNSNNFGMLSEFDKSVYFIRKNIYDNIIRFLQSNGWKKIYANIVCEIIMFMNVLNGDHRNIDFDEIETNACYLKKTDGFEVIMNQIPESKKKELIYKIRNVTNIDLSIIDDFFEIYEEEPHLKETQWFYQIKGFISEYKNHRNLIFPERIHDGHWELIEILLNTYQDPETFWWRMLRIIPNPMSSGEVALINIFSSIYKVMTEQTEGSILLIVDEIDAYLHPKWQQSILTHIVKWINESEKFNNKKVQIVLASHSPIILSDIPNDRVIYLKSLCKVTKRETLTFGANINQLFYDSFFMEEGSIGAFSKYKIQKAVDYTKNTAKDISKEEVEYIIENIGEPFVKRKLQRDLNHKYLTGQHNDKN